MKQRDFQKHSQPSILLGKAFVLLFSSNQEHGNHLDTAFPELLLNEEVQKGSITFQNQKVQAQINTTRDVIATNDFKEEETNYQLAFSIQNRVSSRYQIFGNLFMSKQLCHNQPTFALSYARMHDGAIASEVEINTSILGDESYLLLRTKDDYIDVRKEGKKTVFLHEYQRYSYTKAVEDKEEGAIYFYKGAHSSYRTSYDNKTGIAAIGAWLRREDKNFYQAIQKERSCVQLDDSNFLNNAVDLCMQSYPKQYKKTIFNIK